MMVGITLLINAIPMKMDPIPQNPSFPGPDRIYRKPFIMSSCFSDTQMVKVQKSVAPGQANTPIFHPTAAQGHGKADFL
jgi:hypothetical protein